MITTFHNATLPHGVKTRNTTCYLLSTMRFWRSKHVRLHRRCCAMKEAGKFSCEGSGRRATNTVGKGTRADVLALKDPKRGLDRVKQPRVAWRERLENERRKAAVSSVQPRCAQVQESSRKACATVASQFGILTQTEYTEACRGSME